MSQSKRPWIMLVTALMFLSFVASCDNSNGRGGSGRNGGQKTPYKPPISDDEGRELALRIMDGETIDDLVAAWKEFGELVPADERNQFHIDDSLDRTTQVTLAYWFTFGFYGGHFANFNEGLTAGKISLKEKSIKEINLARMVLGLPTLGVDEEVVELAHRLSNDLIALAMEDKKWSERYIGWSGFWDSSKAGLIQLIEGAPPADQTSLAILRRDQEIYEKAFKKVAADLNEIQTMRHALSKRNGIQFVRIWDEDLGTERIKQEKKDAD